MSRPAGLCVKRGVMPAFISEDDMEQALVGRLSGMGFETLNCYTENRESLPDGSGRTDKRDVVLADRLRAAMTHLNPALPASAIDQGVTELTHSRAAMSPVEANQEVYALIRGGVPVAYQNMDGHTELAVARVVDFDNPDNNDLLAVTQLWIAPTGNGQRWRRPDVLLYINGLPLVFIELKNSNVKLRTAYEKNLTDYRADIPQLFVYNAFLLLSNAMETRIGSITATWDYFFHWLRPDDEKEKIDRKTIETQGTSLERAADGLLAPVRLLDYIENFILFYRNSQKIIAQNHQYIGVNRALKKLATRDEAGKLGVFWHTQGSGKSFSMIFYVRKIQRKIGGQYTFVVITDRDDLDGQIYRNFLNTNTVQKHEAARPANSAKLREALSQHKRIVFTLIQKFRYEKGKNYPLLSDRSDIIVIVDEAHRTQYKSLAENMRAGLPNAGYLAFTGTPLLGKGRKTHAWFGGYVSEYNFRQSMDDGATVPLFYEKRVPEMQIQNEDLNDEFYELLEKENLTEAEEAKLEKEFARETEVIKRPDRLDTIARDIVYHFPRRGYLGKGMVITVDKYTAVTMYDLVQTHWQTAMRKLQGEIGRADKADKPQLKATLAFMRTTDMAVVISEEAGEEEKFSDRGLNIAPHRARINRVDAEGQDIEANFKDPEHPLRLVFVCAMWLTGFDAPSLSTLYMDKPQKDHTLMQTIARANRVTGYVINGQAKRHGEVIDYYNVFRNMKRALADYAEGDDEEMPVREKAELFKLLDQALDEAVIFLRGHDIDLPGLLDGAEGTLFKKLTAFERYADTLLASDTDRRTFNVYENTVSSLYEACKPEIFAQPKRSLIPAIQYLRGVVDGMIDAQDVDALRREIGELLDVSVVTDKNQREDAAQYKIVQRGKHWDLSKIDPQKLQQEFPSQPYKHIEIEDLRAFLDGKIKQLLEQNSTRRPFAERFAEIIDRYNAGGSSVEQAWKELTEFAAGLGEEEQRHIREGLTEEELELFDILQKDGLTKAEEQQVKLAARALLKRLQETRPKVLIEGWERDNQSRKRVKSAMEEVLDDKLPDTFDKHDFSARSEQIFELLVAQAGTRNHARTGYNI